MLGFALGWLVAMAGPLYYIMERGNGTTTEMEEEADRGWPLRDLRQAQALHNFSVPHLSRNPQAEHERLQRFQAQGKSRYRISLN